ncbi:reverse transcriptase domain-containing protein [Herpetosiphon geysericola]|uniref:Reverse transcriptase domain-containing protein n=1 Tax=Herpetosiphon geysericola TaxID=70996 RepID=A0A0P6YRC5_9CHLR|nr:reverse transcriptase domain-containing protein [Herpetosiphon geysericola]KPL85753.1 hypothetical protein SE18_15590 [Herpetosiphon geysericola]
MLTATEQLVTAIKLRELGLQREQALATYAEISQQLATLEQPHARINLLQEQLQQLTFAKQPLHPSISNMRLLSDPATPASQELTAWWSAELERELASGQLRAELVSIFGAVFQEWLDNAETDAPHAEQAQRLVERINQPGMATKHGPVLDLIFHDQLDPESRAELTTLLHAEPALLDDDLRAAMLRRIANDSFYSAATRAEARQILGDPIMLKELGDALLLLREHLANWRWPKAGVAAVAQYARTKWRLFLQEDLLTACLHYLVAEQWQAYFAKFCQLNNTLRLKKLKRIAQDRGYDRDLNKLIAESYTLAKSVNLWHRLRRPLAHDAAEQLELYGNSSSIFASRASEIQRLQQWSQLAEYDAQYAHNLEIALRLINAEIQLGLHATPDQPIYVLKTDFRDYYPSLNQQFVLDILQRMGLSEQQLGFFAEYMAVPLHVNQQATQQQIGLPNHRPISDILGELVLRLLEQYLELHAHVQIVRFVDDLTIIATDSEELVLAWRALQTWCASCGLALNQQKTGAIAINGQLPSELPQQAPHWLFLTLDNAGSWQLDQRLIREYINQTTQAITNTPAILNKIEVYNGACSYLCQAIGLRVNLGARHREQVRTTLWRYGQQVIQQGSMVAYVGDLIRQRLQSRVQLPEAWFHWPMTAGGLGIQQPLIIAHSYQEAWQTLSAPTAPAERSAWWQQNDNPWASFYRHWLQTIEPSEPEANSVLTSLTDDFIARGGEVRASEQAGLSAYWRWILALYGPQILERCGSFRFLFTELVPLQLIARKSANRLHGTLE